MGRVAFKAMLEMLATAHTADADASRVSHHHVMSPSLVVRRTTTQIDRRTVSSATVR
jgi:hypothetical protein